MMKTLYIMRHAKSSWDYPELDDYERPLNKRGERDSPRMATWLSKQSDLPEKIITSGAKRAHELAKQVQNSIGCPLKINDDLYGTNAKSLLKLVRSYDDEFERIETTPVSNSRPIVAHREYQIFKKYESADAY